MGSNPGKLRRQRARPQVGYMMKKRSLNTLLGAAMLGVVLTGFSLPTAPSGSRTGVTGEVRAPAIARYGTVEDEHVCLVYPTPRVGADCNSGSPQKTGPCGQPGRS